MRYTLVHGFCFFMLFIGHKELTSLPSMFQLCMLSYLSVLQHGHDGGQFQFNFRCIACAGGIFH